MILYAMGTALAFVVMYREFRGEDKAPLQVKDVVGLVGATLFSWVTVFIYVVVTISFEYFNAKRCYDIKYCRKAIDFLDKFIGKRECPLCPEDKSEKKAKKAKKEKVQNVE